MSNRAVAIRNGCRGPGSPPGPPHRRIDMTATIRQPASALSAVSQRRRSRASLVATAMFSTSAIYLAASAAGVSFNLTDPGKSQAMHLTLPVRSEEHTSELQSRGHLVCRLLLEKKKTLHSSIYALK